MSESDTASAVGGVLEKAAPASKSNAKSEKTAVIAQKDRKTRRSGNDVLSGSGRVESIRIVNASDRIGDYQFNLIDKKGKSRPFELETSDLGRLSMFAGLLCVAQSTNAKVSVTSTLGANGQAYVTELEIKSKR